MCIRDSRIPVLDENGIQKIGARNRLQWKRVLTDATGWNNPKNCELWRSEWAKAVSYTHQFFSKAMQKETHTDMEEV